MSARRSREISLREGRYDDGACPMVLDIVELKMIWHLPHLHQRENYLLDDKSCWVKRGTVAWDDLQAAVEDPAGPLWVNGHSSERGFNDRVPASCLAGLTRSLWLVRPKRLRLIGAVEPGDYGPRRRLRAQFQLCGRSYRLAVTDPCAEQRYLAMSDSEIPLGDAVLCVSLGEAFGEIGQTRYAYKLAAAVITP